MKQEQLPVQQLKQEASDVENKETPKRASLFKALITNAMILATVSPLATQEQTAEPHNVEKNKVEEYVDKVSKNTDNLISFAEAIKFEDGYDRFYAKDEEGNLYINPSVVLSPLQAEVSISERQEGQSLIEVPYRYSRGFNTAEAVSEEERNESRKFLEEKLREVFVEKLIFWDFTNTTKDVYNYHHDNDESNKNISKTAIKNIKITGFSSPEGPAEKGKRSIIPGKIDEENLSLAKKRAKDMEPILKDALSALGIDQKTLTEIISEEVQFSESEIESLANASYKEEIEQGHGDSLQAAYLLIKKYNEGGEISPNSKELLDKIVGSKRKVEIEISYDENKKEKHVVPLPLLLLALYPGLRWLKRTKGSKNVRERFNPTTKEDQFSLQEAQIGTRWNGPAFVKYYTEASEWLDRGEGVLVKNSISDRLMIDEFNPYLGTKKDDVGYMDFIKFIDSGLYTQVFSERQPNNEEILQRVTFGILARWEQNDLAVRTNKGDVLTNQLHYWQDAEKIAWANMTAREIMRLQDIYHRAYDNRDQEEVMDSEKAVYDEIDRQVGLLREQERKIPERKKIRVARVSGRRAFIKPTNYRRKI